jgi:alanyl-tRNA synthetase
MVIEDSNTEVLVLDVQKAAGGRIISHRVRVESGEIVAKTSVLETKVDKDSRRRAKANHTATHLLQSALKQVMGDDVSQAGSLVSFDRLRFDFNSSRGPKPNELEEIEALVNEWIFDSTNLEVAEMPIADAKAKGATMMFGEKYGDVVRVVDVPNVSMELCGGTHVSNTSEICGFKILSESGIASGIRRIEAVAGPAVIDLVNSNAQVVNTLTKSLKIKPEEIPDRVKSMQKDLLEQQKLAEKLRGELAVAKASSLKSLAESHPSAQTQVLVAKMDEFVAPDALKVACESLLKSLGPDALVLLASASDDNTKVAIVCAAGDDAVKKGLNAGKICGATAKACGGGGGGKPNFAQAGGRDASNLAEALAAAKANAFETLN